MSCRVEYEKNRVENFYILISGMRQLGDNDKIVLINAEPKKRLSAEYSRSDQAETAESIMDTRGTVFGENSSGRHVVIAIMG